MSDREKRFVQGDGVLLSKRRVVLTRSKAVARSDDGPVFVFESDDGSSPEVVLTLSPATDDEMGRPDVVTVDVRPGDHLNLPG